MAEVVSLDVEGMEELLQQLEELGAAVGRAENAALRAGGTVLQEEVIRRAPRSPSPRQPSGRQTWRTGQHAADNIEMSNVRTDQDGVKHVLVGTGKGDNSPYFYLKFLEWGTSRLRARPFMGPALIEKQDEVAGAMIDVIKGAVERRARSQKRNTNSSAE